MKVSLERMRGSPIIGLLVAVLVAWGFFAWSLWRELASDELQVVRLATGVVKDALGAAPVRHQIAAFIGAQLLIHALLGAIIWLLAAATRRCYPRLRWPMAIWAVSLLGTVYLWNAAQFPASRFAAANERMTSEVIGTVTVIDVLVVAIVVLGLTTLARAAWSLDSVRRRRRELLVAVLTLAAVVLWKPVLMPEPIAVIDADRPHVVIIGVDSLRPDVVGGSERLGFAPHISSFRSAATNFPDTVTPLSRTFAAWSTILSGRHPVHSGARDFLMSAHALDLSPTLAGRLRASGYATAFATDEVRYSNIDGSFGFDRVVSPRMGAADFLIGKIADLPLSNLLVNTRAGALLLPHVYGNRAVAATYRPSTFVNWLERSIDFQRPTFLAVHLTLPHWPYYSADSSREALGATMPNMYAQAVMAADQQFARIMLNLQQRGVLNNAIVIVLSDHGEALGLEQDRLIPGFQVYGHGTSVLSASQYQVLLAIRRYRDSASDPGQVSPAPASLVDITPTVLAMAGLPADAGHFDGVSLAREVQHAGSMPELSSRVRFTETGLAPSTLRAGNFNEAANLREAMSFFSIDPDSGRIVFDPQRLPDLLAQKERAALSGPWQLSALPQTATSRAEYIFVSRSGGAPEIVTEDPDTVADPRFASLWQALQRRFGKEVRPPVE